MDSHRAGDWRGVYHVSTVEHRAEDPERVWFTAKIESAKGSSYGRGATEPAAMRDAVDSLFQVGETVGKLRP